MARAYEIIAAKSPEEAIVKSPFYIGQKGEVVNVRASGNSDGTWTVYPEFKIVEDKK